jgi:hypothetical protein
MKQNGKPTFTTKGLGTPSFILPRPARGRKEVGEVQTLEANLSSNGVSVIIDHLKILRNQRKFNAVQCKVRKDALALLPAFLPADLIDFVFHLLSEPLCV